MKPVSVAAIYLLFWVLTLFAVLPFGVKTSDEAGEKPLPGQADSAPVNPQLGRKLVWTTVISAALFALFWLNYVYGWVRIEDVPGWN
jgi:predicted secreted protein